MARLAAFDIVLATEATDNNTDLNVQKMLPCQSVQILYIKVFKTKLFLSRVCTYPRGTPFADAAAQGPMSRGRWCCVICCCPGNNIVLVI